MRRWTESYCALQGYQIACRGKLDLHHIISYGKAQGSKEVKAILKTNPPELCIFLCQRHHQRFGNSRAVRRKLLYLKIEEFGEDWMRFIIDSLPWKIKRHEMTLDGLLTKTIDKA